jgi:HlyD family secretion protein
MVSLNQKRKIFRDAALDHANSPEQLDRMIIVTSPRRWLSLAAFAVLVTAGTAWSVWAKIPITVTGKGILVYPSTIQAAQSNTAGQILEVKVKSGDTVKKGQVLATIDQSELKQQLQLAQAKLEDLKRQDRDADFVKNQREKFEQVAAQQERQSLQQSLDTVRSMAPTLRDKGLDSIQSERAALQQQLQTLTASLPQYKLRWEKRQHLYEVDKAATEDVAIQARTEYEGIQAQISQVEAQLKQLDAKAVAAEQQDLNNLNQVNEIQAKIEALTAQKVTKVEQDFGASSSRQLDIQETERTIAQLNLQLQKSREIVSAHDGTFLEVLAKAGQRIEPGASVGTLSIPGASNQLKSLVFLDPSEGKKVESAATMAQTQKKPKLEVKITPTTVKSEEYGGIIGHVEQVDPLPVTQEGAVSLVGNPNMLKGLIAENTSQMVIFTSLDCKDAMPMPANCQQYRWSGSNGTGQPLTQGTTTTVRITIEERTPITYILPFLKNLIGTAS